MTNKVILTVEVPIEDWMIDTSNIEEREWFKYSMNNISRVFSVCRFGDWFACKVTNVEEHYEED